MTNERGGKSNESSEYADKPATFADSIGTTQFSPRIVEDLAEDYKDMVRLQNDGAFRSKFGPFLEEGLKFHLALHFLVHPDDLENIRKVENIENAAEFKKTLRAYARTAVGDLTEILEELPEEVVKKATNQTPAAEIFGDTGIQEGHSDDHGEQREKAQIGPQVRSGLSDVYKNSIRVANNGKFRTNFGPFVERGMKYHMAICLLRDDALEEKINRADYIEDSAAYIKRLKSYVDEVKLDLARAYLNLPAAMSKKMGTQPMKERLFAEERTTHQTQQDPTEQAPHLFTGTEENLIRNNNFANNSEKYFDNIWQSVDREGSDNVLEPMSRSLQLLEKVLRGIDYENVEQGKRAEYKLLSEIQKALKDDATPADDIISDLQGGASGQTDQPADKAVSEIQEAIQSFRAEEGQSEIIDEIETVIRQTDFGGENEREVIDQIADVIDREFEKGIEPGLERAILNNIRHTIEESSSNRPDRNYRQT